MRKVLSYLLMLPMLLLTLAAYGQDSRIDLALNRYEIICDKCILLKEKTLKGEDISTDELKELLEQVSDLRTTLQKGSNNMSKSQKDRFEIIRRRYIAAFSGQSAITDGAVLKVARPELDLPRLSWRPETGVIGTEILHSAFGYAQSDNRNARKELSLSLIILGGWRPESLSYGALASITDGKSGVYIKGRSNFNNQVKAVYSCLSDGTSNGSPIWTSGNELHSEWSLGAGGILHIAGPVSIYAGSGYGQTQTLWEDSAGKWARVEDYSVKGICADAGLLLSLGHFAASAGISTIGMKKATLEVGLGISF
ncbi:MAG: hypothetical protein IKW99_01645 [Bacteroidales bacterium]|nr:hypothetical protein [Bacteroidales bacterium]